MITGANFSLHLPQLPLDFLGLAVHGCPSPSRLSPPPPEHLSIFRKLATPTWPPQGPPPQSAACLQGPGQGRRHLLPSQCVPHPALSGEVGPEDLAAGALSAGHTQDPEGVFRGPAQGSVSPRLGAQRWQGGYTGRTPAPKDSGLGSRRQKGWPPRALCSACQ